MILVELIKNINSLISAEISVLLGNTFFSPSYLHFLYQFVNKCTIHLKFQPYPTRSFSINDLETHFSVKVKIPRLNSFNFHISLKMDPGLYVLSYFFFSRERVLFKAIESFSVLEPISSCLYLENCFISFLSSRL